MNVQDDCMVELTAHKSENCGHVSKVFVDYLCEKYGIATTGECMRSVKIE
tara:strand:+ start:678 stop:827 length:150 start_codon:yes stop_codon:yes gene_type:complete